ncbi:hypothetical protein M0R45_007704 [Rubus argutus]|uniref:Secreted protein n=1 Tax=Rubus argutus TaxID=59490 RepID=A0AAW1Y1H0_RUBAR
MTPILLLLSPLLLRSGGHALPRHHSLPFHSGHHARRHLRRRSDSPSPRSVRKRPNLGHQPPVQPRHAGV